MNLPPRSEPLPSDEPSSLASMPSVSPPVALPPTETEMRLVTTAMAQHWLSRREQEYQRISSERHAEILAEHMRRGTFEDTQSINFHRVLNEDGAPFLTNGQHRLRAIVLSGIAQWMPIVTKWVETREDMRLAYSRMDRGLMRTHRDVFRAQGIEQALGLNTKQVERYGAAAGVLLRGFRDSEIGARATRDAGNRAQVMLGWADEARDIFALYEGLSTGHRDRLLVAIPFALALVTFRHQPHKARIFWREVAWGQDLSAADTTFHLREALRDPPKRRGALSERILMWKIARAWNAFYHGRLVTTFHNTTGPQPLALAGTPFNGKPQPPIRA